LSLLIGHELNEFGRLSDPIQETIALKGGIVGGKPVAAVSFNNFKASPLLPESA